MNNQPIKQSFDYSQFPDNILHQLIESTIIIRESMKRTGQEIILIGLELIKAKELIEHGHFEDWYQVEFQLSKQMANNFMNVAKVYGKSKIILLFKPTILYELAAPSTPEQVRSEVEQKIQQGEEITVKAIKELKSQLKQKDSRIKELSGSIDQNDQFFKQTLNEIQQENLKTIQQLSLENENLKNLIIEHRSASLVPESALPMSDNSAELQALNNQIAQRDAQLNSLTNQLQALQQQKADDKMLIIQRMKQDHQREVDQLIQQLDQLKTAMSNPDEPSYEYDSDFEFNIATFSQMLDQISSNGYLSNEQLKDQLQQIHDQIADILERTELALT